MPAEAQAPGRESNVFICTLDAGRGPRSIPGMNSQWIDRAERLRAELAHLRAAQQHAAPEPHLDEIEAYERVTIARWLRDEFSEEQPEDTATLTLFPDATPDWPAGRR
jgi:hypothetical protein